MVRVGDIREAKILGVPIHRGLGESASYAAEQHGFRERARVVEVCAGLRAAQNRVYEKMIMVSVLNLRHRVFFKLRFGK